MAKFRLDEINKIKDYFNFEIKERKEPTKKEKNLVNILFYFTMLTKIFITLSASFGTLSLVSHATVVGIPAGIVGSSLTVLFSVTTGIVEILLNTTRNKKKKHNKIIVLAKNKLNIIEKLMSQTLIDFNISHEDIKEIIDEKEN